ncbi:MAG: class I mannose-6-phosphate isomerase [Bacteroidales bacterium]|nr:class I mannose-6-phosphate isomerase [Bacteroidales bacterium]
MYSFEPILRPMVWGSELWVLSGYPERLSVVADGEHKGLTINELVALEKERLLGAEGYRRFGDEFPLLIKFLDVHAPLSIQVHPSEEFAQARQGLHGKTEMWYVVKAERDAELLAGFARQITPEEYVRRVTDGSITDVIARHKIEAGDVFFIPTGRVHALLPGAYIAEIQQTSDSTYRIWDYNRPGLDGRLRPLHTELAKEALDYKVYPEYRTPYSKQKDAEVGLVSCEYFNTSLLELSAPFRKDLSALDSFLIVMCLEGSGTLRCGSQERPLAPDGCLLVPASEESAEFVPSGDGLKMLLCHL